jgi:hypothetical protein
MLGAAVAAVLVIACVNIAALLLSRGGTRAKEIATRIALGSGRAAVVRQLLVESVVLALLGGLAGLLLGAIGLDVLKSLGGDTFGDGKRATLDGRVIALMAGLSLLTSVLFGLVPAWQASRIDVNATLQSGGSRSVAGGARRWPRRLLVVGEVMLGVTLLVTTGLLLRTFVKLRGLDPGFNPTGVMTAKASMEDARYRTAATVSRLFNDSLVQLSKDPAIASAGVSLCAPFQRLLNMGFRLRTSPRTTSASRTCLTSPARSSRRSTFRCVPAASCPRSTTPRRRPSWSSTRSSSTSRRLTRRSSAAGCASRGRSARSSASSPTCCRRRRVSSWMA